MNRAFFPLLEPGHQVEIIAPASRCSDQKLALLRSQLVDWGLNCVISETIFGKDLLCANSDALRFQGLLAALHNDANHAILCARGGYGASRLLPHLYRAAKPQKAKIFIGLSDITALHLFLNQQWGWSSIHGSLSPNVLTAQSVTHLQQLLFSKKNLEFTNLVPLNDAARRPDIFSGRISGGNLTLIQTSLGTPWQIDSTNKILVLEEINERGYKIDRALMQLQQAGVFAQAKAILLGDFLGGEELNGRSYVDSVLERFARQIKAPVVRIPGVGHGATNFALPLNTDCILETTDGSARLLCQL